MSQPPSTQPIQSSNTNDNAKFNFVDMTKDVEFKTRNKGDKSLKVNKQFRYNKRFQNNFFIFKTGQQPGNNETNNEQTFYNDNQMQFNGVTNSNLTLDEPLIRVPSTSTNPLVDHQSNQYRINGRFAKRTSNNTNQIPPYITNSETFNLLNSNAQLMILMGSSFDNQYQISSLNEPLSTLMDSNNNNQISNHSFFLEEEEEYTDPEQFQESLVNRYFPTESGNEINSRKMVTRSNSFTFSQPQEKQQDIPILGQRAMSVPTVVFDNYSTTPKQTPADDNVEIWIEEENKPKNNKKRQRKSFLFTSSSSGSSSGSSSHESSAQNSYSNSPNTNVDILMVGDKKKGSSPQYKKKNLQQEQFEIEFLETNQEESRDELDMLLDSIILENNQFN